MPRTPSLRAAEQWFSENAKIIDVLLESLGPAVYRPRYKLCAACGGEVGKPSVVCECRGARYCSDACAELDKAAHAPECGVRRHMARVGDAAGALSVECCVCYQAMRVSARNYSTGHTCENGHHTCTECYHQITAATPATLRIPMWCSNGEVRQYTVLTQNCPACRCAMAGNSVATVENAMRMVVLPDRPEGGLWAEAIVRSKQGMHTSFVDPLCEAEMRLNRLPFIGMAELRQAGERLLRSDVSGYHAEFIFNVLRADGLATIDVQTGDVRATLTSSSSASKWAAMHGKSRACYTVGRAMIARAVAKGQCAPRALTVGARYLHSAACQGVVKAVMTMALAAAQSDSPRDALQWLTSVPLVNWVREKAGPFVVLQAELSFQCGRWEWYVRCMEACPPSVRNWYAIGQSLDALADQAGEVLTLSHLRAARGARNMIRGERNADSKKGRHVGVLLAARKVHVDALAAFAYGSAACSKCAEAAAHAIEQHECNWTLKRVGQEQLPVHFFRRAAAQGSVSAMERLGHLFVHNFWVAPRLDEARAWLKRAVAAGSTTAGLALEGLPPVGAVRCAARHAGGKTQYCAPEAFSRRQRAQKWHSRRCASCIKEGNHCVAPPKGVPIGKYHLAGLFTVIYHFKMCN